MIAIKFQKLKNNHFETKGIYEKKAFIGIQSGLVA